MNSTNYTTYNLALTKQNNMPKSNIHANMYAYGKTSGSPLSFDDYKTSQC
jgi:hypothetical protein